MPFSVHHHFSHSLSDFLHHSHISPPGALWLIHHIRYETEDFQVNLDQVEDASQKVLGLGAATSFPMITDLN